MKKCLLALMGSSILFASSVSAGAVDHSVQASTHSGLAVSEGLASTAMVASAVVAVPVVVVAGSSLVAASVVVEAGDALADSARHSHSHHHHHRTLVITERTITAGPAPKVVMKNTDNQ